MTQEDEYNDILEKAFNKVKKIEKGALFECIETLVNSKHSERIIKQFDIKKSNSYSEDLKVLEKIPSLNFILKPIILAVSNPVNFLFHNTIMPVLNPTGDYTNSMNAETQVSNVESSNPLSNALIPAKHFLDHTSPALAIVLIASVVIGLYFIGQNKKNSSRKIRSKRQQDDGSLSLEMYHNRDFSQEENDTISQQVLEADLCLVIPCNCIASDLRNQMGQGKKLSSADTIALIDNSAYFLVAKSREEPMFQLDRNFAEFPEDGYLFIRLRISDKRDLTKIDLQGSLSEAICSQEPMIIQEIGLRQDFSNLEKFHRA